MKRAPKRKPRIHHQDYLDSVHMLGGSRCVVACDLVAAASLVKLGFANVEDDYEGPRIYLTPLGLEQATLTLSGGKGKGSVRKK